MSEERDTATRWCFYHDCKAYRPPVCGEYCYDTSDYDWHPDCDFGWKSYDGRLTRTIEFDLEAAAAMFAITSRRAATRTEYDDWEEPDKAYARREAKAILRASGIRDIDDED